MTGTIFLRTKYSTMGELQFCICSTTLLQERYKLSILRIIGTWKNSSINPLHYGIRVTIFTPSSSPCLFRTTQHPIDFGTTRKITSSILFESHGVESSQL